MKASIIKIGNSKGVRIPKPLLEESGIDGPIIITASAGVIKIVPSPKNSKKAAVNEEALLSEVALSDWLRPEEDEAWKSLQ